MLGRLFVVFLLGFSSGLPLALITSTLQAWFASTQISIFATSLLSLISFPYLYRFIWGPVVDRYSLFSLGKRRSWMLSMQLLLLFAFNFLAWFKPNSSPGVMACCSLAIAFFSATQDIAIDAHRVEYLPPSEQALGASLAVLGYRLALIIAGGIALILVQYLGWANTYRAIGSLMLVGVFATLFSKEPYHAMQASGTLFQAGQAAIKDLFQRKDFLFLILFIVFFKLGEAFTTTTSGIVMPFLIQGLGFSLKAIGYINQIVGISAILGGGLTAGVLLLRCSLYRCLLFFGILQALANLLFLGLAMVGQNMPLLCIAVVSDNFAAGLGSTALVAFFMKIVKQPYTATQFALLVAIASLPRVFSGPIAGVMQFYWGWQGLYELAFILSLVFIPFLKRLRYRMESNELQNSSTAAVAP